MALILVVDPNPMIREVTVRALTRAGFGAVLEASDGPEALETVRTYPEMNLVVSDLEVGSGRQEGITFVHALRERRPRLRIILAVPPTAVSGFPFRTAVKLDHVMFLQKPWRLEELVGAVRTMLS